MIARSRPEAFTAVQSIVPWPAETSRPSTVLLGQTLVLAASVVPRGSSPLGGVDSFGRRSFDRQAARSATESAAERKRKDRIHPILLERSASYGLIFTTNVFAGPETSSTFA